jgi:hypothetical protein
MRIARSSRSKGLMLSILCCSILALRSFFSKTLKCTTDSSISARRLSLDFEHPLLSLSLYFLCLSLFEHPLLSLSLYFLCSSLFLFEVIEMYNRYEYQQVEARL